MNFSNVALNMAEEDELHFSIVWCPVGIIHKDTPLTCGFKLLNASTGAVGKGSRVRDDSAACA